MGYVGFYCLVIKAMILYIYNIFGDDYVSDEASEDID